MDNIWYVTGDRVAVRWGEAFEQAGSAYRATTRVFRLTRFEKSSRREAMYLFASPGQVVDETVVNAAKREASATAVPAPAQTPAPPRSEYPTVDTVAQLIAEKFADYEPGTVTAESITDATAIGRQLLRAGDVGDARAAIGAGTSSLGLGTGATTAKAGDYVPAWGEVTGKPAAFPPAAHGHTAADVSGLAAVATAGTYASLTGKPTIPAGYTDEQAQDAAAALLTGGTHTGISFVYDDPNGKVNASVTGGTATVGALGFPYTVDPAAAVNSNVIGAANRSLYLRILGGGTITKLGFEVTAAAGNISLAVYRNTGVGRASLPGARLASVGPIACPAVGYVEIPLGASIVVNDGDWFAFASDNASTALRGGTNNVYTSDIYAGRAGYTSADPVPANVTGLVASIPRMPLLIGIP